MYKIKHWLFGWDYILWSTGYDQGVARVFKLPCGTLHYWQYECISVIGTIKNSGDVYWLTCPPSKYGF